MIDRVPFLPEAVLVCFDTLNVRIYLSKSYCHDTQSFQADLRVQPPSPAAAAASAAAVPDIEFPLFVTLTRSEDLR